MNMAVSHVISILRSHGSECEPVLVGVIQYQESLCFFFFIFPLISIISVIFLSDLSQKKYFNLPGVPCQRKVKAPDGKKVDCFVVF